MNIDRDDEYATRYEAAPTITEQIAIITESRDNALIIAEIKSGEDREAWLQDAADYTAILASLEKLAALESQPVPVEPETFKFAIDIDTPVAYVVLKDDYDTLRDYAVQMKAENEKWQERVFEFDTCIQEVADELGACCGGVDGDQADPLSTTQVLLKAICHIKQRAEKAEAILIQHYCDYEFKPTLEQAAEMMLEERNEKKALEAENAALREDAASLAKADLILIADKQKWDAEGKLAGIADTIAAVRRNINPFDDPQLDYLGDMREEIWEIQFSADRRKNERAEQAEKDREICYASLQDMRHRLHEIAALSADPRLDEKHAEQTFKEHCFWIQDSDGSWGTGCGHCFEFNHGGPDENEAKFCMYCGLPMAAQIFGP